MACILFAPLAAITACGPIMCMATIDKIKPVSSFPANTIPGWRVAQVAVWLLGAGILFCLLFIPQLGILLFWNILIPLAPAIFVFAAGVWRNVCPLATTTLLPRHLGLSKQKRLTVKRSGIFGVLAVATLYLVVPLRHAVFNISGPATAGLIIVLTLVGVTAGFFYEWKSAWCNGLCPVHPVEKLYGRNVVLTMPNAHCTQCRHCAVPCPDSTPNIRPAVSGRSFYHQLSANLVAGGLPGFIWGWFQVPDDAGISGAASFAGLYLLPFSGLAISLAVYLLLSQKIFPGYKTVITNLFAAAAVSCYYWYRIPWLFGFGSFGHDGLLVNLTGLIPAWSIYAITVATTALFFYRIVIKKSNRNSWLVRPPYPVKTRAAVKQEESSA